MCSRFFLSFFLLFFCFAVLCSMLVLNTYSPKPFVPQTKMLAFSYFCCTNAIKPHKPYNNSSVCIMKVNNWKVEHFSGQVYFWYKTGQVTFALSYKCIDYIFGSKYVFNIFTLLQVIFNVILVAWSSFFFFIIKKCVF